jgi:hypothetical protein
MVSSDPAVMEQKYDELAVAIREKIGATIIEKQTAFLLEQEQR